MKLFVFVLMTVILSGCSRKGEFDCTDRIKSTVAVGSNINIAEEAVKACGLEYSINKETRVLRAIKRGQKKGVTQESRAVIINFDESGNVKSVEVKKEFTGP